MDIEITPEPSEEERKAILEALRDEEDELDELTPWRWAGLCPEPDQAGAEPRHSRGATRA